MHKLIVISSSIFITFLCIYYSNGVLNLIHYCYEILDCKLITSFIIGKQATKQNVYYYIRLQLHSSFRILFQNSFSVPSFENIDELLIGPTDSSF